MFDWGQFGYYKFKKDDWQLMATAPRDGSSFRACDFLTSGFQMIVQFEHCDRGYHWASEEGLCYSDEMFTHWQALGPFPVRESDDGAVG